MLVFLLQALVEITSVDCLRRVENKCLLLLLFESQILCIIKSYVYASI
jgi:hypothetical protein